MIEEYGHGYWNQLTEHPVVEGKEFREELDFSHLGERLVREGMSIPDVFIKVWGLDIHNGSAVQARLRELTVGNGKTDTEKKQALLAAAQISNLYRKWSEVKK